MFQIIPQEHFFLYPCYPCVRRGFFRTCPCQEDSSEGSEDSEEGSEDEERFRDFVVMFCFIFYVLVMFYFVLLCFSRHF